MILRPAYIFFGIVFLMLGGMMSLVVKSKTKDTVKCEVIDGGELKSRRHLNVRGKSANLPSITGSFCFHCITLIFSLNLLSNH